MTFGGKMQHRLWLMGSKDPVQSRTVPDIGLLEDIAWGAFNRGQICQTGRIRQRIEIDDLMPVFNCATYDR